MKMMRVLISSQRSPQSNRPWQCAGLQSPLWNHLKPWPIPTCDRLNAIFNTLNWLLEGYLKLLTKAPVSQIACSNPAQNVALKWYLDKMALSSIFCEITTDNIKGQLTWRGQPKTSFQDTLQSAHPPKNHKANIGPWRWNEAEVQQEQIRHAHIIPFSR